MEVDFSSIPQEAIEKVKDCTTADDVIELAQQYDIEITQDMAEAALAAGGEDLESYALGDCRDKIARVCENCKHYEYLFLTWESKCMKDGREKACIVEPDQPACVFFENRWLTPVSY